MSSDKYWIIDKLTAFCIKNNKLLYIFDLQKCLQHKLTCGLVKDWKMPFSFYTRICLSFRVKYLWKVNWYSLSLPIK